MLTLKPSDLWAVSKTESISITTTTHTKTKPIDHQTQNELISAGTSPISILRTKNRSLSTRTPKPSQIRPLTQNIELISTPLPRSGPFDPHSHIKSISMPPQKNMLNSIQIPRLSVFRPPRKQVNSGPCVQLKSILIPTIKSSQF